MADDHHLNQNSSEDLLGVLRLVSIGVFTGFRFIHPTVMNYVILFDPFFLSVALHLSTKGGVYGVDNLKDGQLKV